MILVEKDGVTFGANDDAQLDAFLGEGWKVKEPKKPEPKPKVEKKTTAKPAAKKSGKAKKEQ